MKTNAKPIVFWWQTPRDEEGKPPVGRKSQTGSPPKNVDAKQNVERTTPDTTVQFQRTGFLSPGVTLCSPAAVFDPSLLRVKKAEGEEPRKRSRLTWNEADDDEEELRQRAARVVRVLLKEETADWEGREAIKQYMNEKGRPGGVQKVRMMLENGEFFTDVLEGRTQNPFAMETNLKLRMQRLCSSVWDERAWVHACRGQEKYEAQKKKYDADVERLNRVSVGIIHQRLWMADVGKMMVEEEQNGSGLEEILERCVVFWHKQELSVENVVKMARPLAVALKLSGRAKPEVRSTVKKKMLMMAREAETARSALVWCAASIATDLVRGYEIPQHSGGPYDCAMNQCYKVVGWEGAKCYECLVREASTVVITRKGCRVENLSEEEMREAEQAREIQDEEEMNFDKEKYELWKVREREKLENEFLAENHSEEAEMIEEWNRSEGPDSEFEESLWKEKRELETPSLLGTGIRFPSDLEARMVKFMDVHTKVSLANTTAGGRDILKQDLKSTILQEHFEELGAELEKGDNYLRSLDPSRWRCPRCPVRCKRCRRCLENDLSDLSDERFSCICGLSDSVSTDSDLRY